MNSNNETNPLREEHRKVIGCSRVKENPNERSHCVCGWGLPEARQCKHAVFANEPDERITLNFTEFQIKLRGLLIIKDGFDNEWMHDFYIDFKEMPYPDLKEWAETFFQDISLRTHPYCLVTKLSNPSDDALQSQPLPEEPKGEKSLQDYRLVKMLNHIDGLAYSAALNNSKGQPALSLKERIQQTLSQFKQPSQPEGKTLEEYPLFWFMRDNHTFIRLFGDSAEDVKKMAIDVARENNYGMVCPVTILKGEKEIKRVGKAAHVDGQGEVDLSEWWDEIIKEECIRNYAGQTPPQK